MEAKIIEYEGRKYGGYDKCPKWLKDAFRRAVNYKCQDCGKDESKIGKLEPHRQTRGKEGGLYVCVPLNHPLNNVKMLCKICHDRYDYSSKKPAWTVGSKLKN